MIKTIITICFASCMIMSTSYANDLETLASEPAQAVNPQLLEVLHRLAVIEQTLKFKPHQESALVIPPNDFAEVARQHWTHSPTGLLICMKTMEQGECFERVAGQPGKEERMPHPWLTPQKFLEHAFPERKPKLVNIDFYPPTAKLFLYYAIDNQ